MNIYIVSLDIEKAYRSNEFLNILVNSDYNTEIVNAINGNKISAAQYFNSIVDSYKRENILISPPELGCTLSHLEALYKFRESREEFALILEDDILAELSDINIIEKHLSYLDDNSIMLCGGLNNAGIDNKIYGSLINNNLYKISYLSRTHLVRTCSYVVTQQSAFKIIQAHESYLKKADDWYNICIDIKNIYFINQIKHPMNLSNSTIESSRIKLAAGPNINTSLVSYIRYKFIKHYNKSIIIVILNKLLKYKLIKL